MISRGISTRRATTLRRWSSSLAPALLLASECRPLFPVSPSHSAVKLTLLVLLCIRSWAPRPDRTLTGTFQTLRFSIGDQGRAARHSTPRRRAFLPRTRLRERPARLFGPYCQRENHFRQRCLRPFFRPHCRLQCSGSPSRLIPSHGERRGASAVLFALCSDFSGGLLFPKTRRRVILFTFAIPNHRHASLLLTQFDYLQLTGNSSVPVGFMPTFSSFNVNARDGLNEPDPSANGRTQ